VTTGTVAKHGSVDPPDVEQTLVSRLSRHVTLAWKQDRTRVSLVDRRVPHDHAATLSWAVLGAFLCDIMDSLSDERPAEVTRTQPGWPGPKASLSRSVSASSLTRNENTDSMPNVI
jgi:hypothetical protein